MHQNQIEKSLSFREIDMTTTNSIPYLSKFDLILSESMRITL